jgi:hypothetical protein
MSGMIRTKRFAELQNANRALQRTRRQTVD